MKKVTKEKRQHTNKLCQSLVSFPRPFDSFFPLVRSRVRVAAHAYLAVLNGGGDLGEGLSNELDALSDAVNGLLLDILNGLGQVVVHLGDVAGALLEVRVLVVLEEACVEKEG